MKRLVAVLMLSALAASAFAAPAAQAKKKRPAPATLYFHGTQYVGEAETPDGVSGLYRTMDATEPTDPAPKSVSLLAAGSGGSGTPNSQCAGNPLFPVWVGDVNGTIVGDLKLSLDSVSLPATKVDVRVWGFVPGVGACDSQGVEAYVEPFAETRVDVPPGPGTIEAVLENKKFKTLGKLMVQITPVLDGATATRVLYDSASAVSQIEFSCAPASGASCLP
jgi:hypothetical protein